MFSNEIADLLSNKPIDILRMLATNDPEKFRQDVASFDKEGCSFFTAFLTKNSNLDFIKELFSLCEEYGYDFKGTCNTYKSRSFYKFDKKQTVLPEYIAILTKCFNDETVAFLTEKMGKDELLRLEKEGWRILEEAFSNGLFKTVQILCDYGFNYETTPSGTNILKLIDGRQDKIDLYWAIKEKTEKKENVHMSVPQFEHFRESVRKQICYIDKKKDDKTASIINIITKKNDVLSNIQKEKLLYDSVACKDTSLFKFLAKSLDYKLNSERLKEIMLANLDKCKSQEFLYMVLEDKANLFMRAKTGVNRRTLEDGQTIVEVNEQKNVYGIDQILKCLFNLSIDPFDRYSANSRGNDGIMARTTKEKLLKLFNSDHILLEKMSNGLSMFEKIASVPSYFQKFQSILCVSLKDSESSHLSAIPSLTKSEFELIAEGKKEFSAQQVIEIKDFLHKTWMKRDEYGKFLLTQVTFGDIASAGAWLFSLPVIMHKEILSLEEKVELFNHIINATTQYSSSVFEKMSTWDELGTKDSLRNKVLKSLYQSLIQTDEMRWSNVVISSEVQDYLKNAEFLYELKARQLEQELKTDVNQNSDKVNKQRTKI